MTKTLSAASVRLIELTQTEITAPKIADGKNMKEQSNNTRRNRMVEYKGELKTLTEWANILNFNYSVALWRIDKGGWSVEKAFETPVRKHKNKSESKQ